MPVHQEARAIRQRIHQNHLKLEQEYLRHFGLDDWPFPETLEGQELDQATFYQPDGKGGYAPLAYAVLDHGIVRAMEKRWLLAPPPGVEPVETAVATAEMAPQAEVKPKLDRERMARFDAEMAEVKARKDARLVCPDCGRKSRTLSGNQMHQRRSHSTEVTK